MYKHFRSGNHLENMQEYLCGALHITHQCFQIGKLPSQNYARPFPCLFTFHCPQPGFIIRMSSMAECNMEKYKSDPPNPKIGLQISNTLVCSFLFHFTCLFSFLNLYVPADSDVTLSQWMDIFFFQLHRIWSHRQLILDVIICEVFLNLQQEHKGKGIVIFNLFLWKCILPPTSGLLQSRIHKTKEFEKINQTGTELCWGPFLYLYVFIFNTVMSHGVSCLNFLLKNKETIILKFKHKCILCIKTHGCSKGK